MSLGFLSAGLLGGLAVALVPLVIHLISRRRARRVSFAAMEFLLRSQKRAARDVRLRQLLLLLVRTALVLAIALAVAQPAWVASVDEGEATGPIVAVLAIDTSASMRAVSDGETGWQRAVALARDQLRSLPDDVQVAVLTCADAVTDASGAPSFDRGRADRALDVVEPTFAPAELAPCVERASTMAAAVSGEGERRVFVYSDLAGHALRSSASSSAPDGLVVEWVGVFDEPPRNRALTGATLAHLGRPSPDTLQVDVAVAGFGESDDDDEAAVDLWVDGARVARSSLSLAGDGARTRSFTHDFGGGGAEGDPSQPAEAGATAETQVRTARLQLSADALVEDNQIELMVELPPPVQVLVVDGAPQPIPFRDEVFYLEGALRHRKGGLAKLAVDVIRPEQLDASAIGSARVVVLANPPRLSPAATRALLEHVRNGGGLWITAGDQLDPGWANEALGPLLPGELRGEKRYARLDDSSLSETLGLARFDEEHPIFASLLDDDGQVIGLGQVETRTVMLIEPGSRDERRILARFSSDAPALLERRVGEGAVLVWLSSIDRDWSDLAIRPGFVPFVQRSVLYLARALAAEGERVVPMGQTRTLAVPPGTDEVLVESPSGARHEVELEAGDRGRAVARYRAAHEPGLHRVFVRPDGGELRELVRDRFTVLFPSSESDLRLADEDALVEAAPAGAKVEGKRSRGGERPLWPMLFLALVLLTVVEAALLRRG